MTSSGVAASAIVIAPSA